MRHRESPDFQALFGEGGALSRKAPFYEYRPGQVEMAEAVWKAFQGGPFLLAEAGTGTGKSLAYLLPALFSDRRIVVATGTKALQEQLARKDLPLCEQILGRRLKAVVAKGRGNYLCLHYWNRFSAEPLLRDRTEARYLPEISSWAGTTKSGDRAELAGVPEDLALWQDVNARADRCLGSKCPLYRECFLVRLRREAEAAELIITNHHLLFADRAVRRQTDSAVLPEFTHLVLDEAHDAEDAATSFFGLSASRKMLQEWVQDAAKALPANQTSTLAALKAAGEAGEHLFELWAGEERKQLLSPRTLDAHAEGSLKRLWGALDAASLALEAQAANDETEGLLGRMERWRDAVSFVLEERGEDFVRSVECRGRNVILSASPIEVQELLHDHLWSGLHAAVLTSATLTAGGSFTYLRERLGLPDHTAELKLASPFDYAAQGLLFVPGHFPEPASEEFLDAAREAVRELVHASQGRAFVLCTSYRNMRALAEHLSATVPFPVLVQGDEPKGLLLDRFREAGDAVLVATSSFWQGVDVQGEALSLVILDKLPFAPPDDPLTSARIEKLRKRGKDPFQHYQLPSAAIVLQQGAGRLIRSKRDRGVVACLDIRLSKKGYGRLLVASLPAFARTQEMDEVRAFFRV